MAVYWSEHRKIGVMNSSALGFFPLTSQQIVNRYSTDKSSLISKTMMLFWSEKDEAHV